jgi:orotidine-5'-phosphate decarboxylase
MYDPRQHLIVALDVSSAGAARKIVAAVGDSALTYKVGMQLYTAEGPSVVRELVASGLGVTMLTVHAAGGGRMLRAAVEAARDVSSLLVLGVTVLTSMDDQDLDKLGVRGRVVDQVSRLAALAITSGCQGVVASALEASELRSELGENFVIVTPGVRPAGHDPGDQSRVATPAEAVAAGATYIVVGRPITAAPDPAAEARAILEQMSLAVGA